MSRTSGPFEAGFADLIRDSSGGKLYVTGINPRVEEDARRSDKWVIEVDIAESGGERK